LSYEKTIKIKNFPIQQPGFYLWRGYSVVNKYSYVAGADVRVGRNNYANLAGKNFMESLRDLSADDFLRHFQVPDVDSA
jgi:hypothetical protein